VETGSLLRLWRRPRNRPASASPRLLLRRWLNGSGETLRVVPGALEEEEAEAAEAEAEEQRAPDRSDTTVKETPGKGDELCGDSERAG